jgi:hypothetical protein
LLAAVPSADWFIVVENIGAGALTVARNGRLIDELAADLTLQQNQGCVIYTRGDEYLTMRGVGSGGTDAGAVFAGALSARPLPGIANRIYIPIDQPVRHPDFFWDSGSIWIAFLNFRPIIGGAGSVKYLGIESTLVV